MSLLTVFDALESLCIIFELKTKTLIIVNKEFLLKDEIEFSQYIKNESDFNTTIERKLFARMSRRLYERDTVEFVSGLKAMQQ